MFIAITISAIYSVKLFKVQCVIDQMPLSNACLSESNPLDLSEVGGLVERCSLKLKHSFAKLENCSSHFTEYL